MNRAKLILYVYGVRFVGLTVQNRISHGAASNLTRKTYKSYQ